MEYVTFDNFLAEIETTFQNYADSNDLDRISIKGWVIDRLRSFGKNICDTREAVLGVENSRVLLPENFKSLILALKVEGELYSDDEKYREIPFKRYITNDVTWDDISQSYIKNNCQSQIIIESLIIEKQPIENYLNLVPLSLTKGIQGSSIDANCYNLHPSIRNAYPHQISITNRTLNTNFKKGAIYLQYNSLPEQDGEIAIPLISTGDLKAYIENFVKIRITENLIMNNKNPQGIQSLLSMWMQQDRLLEVKARSEANWSGISKDFAQKMYQKNRENQARFNLPK